MSTLHPSSQYLTHKYPIWEGCSLSEIIGVAVLTLLCGFVICFLIGIFIGKVAEAMLLMIPIILIGPKTVLKKIARFKAGKPYGYILIKFRMALEHYGGSTFKTPYIQRVGKWSTQRHLHRVE